MTRPLLLHTSRWSALSLLACACNGTETDNPVAGGSQPPDFDSPPNFEPVSEPPGCVPPDYDAPPRDLPLWGISGSHLVGLDSGLVVIDISDPAAPSLVARHALHGEPRQLLVEGTGVTLVIDELPMFEAPPAQSSEALGPVTRLIRFDISQPGAPVRVADVAIEHEFWRVVPRAGSYWVMSTRVAPPEPSCEVPDPFGCGYVEREALVLERYALAEDSFERSQRTELPMTTRAYSTEHGFAAGTSSALTIARFEPDGALGTPQIIPIAGGGLVPQRPIYIGPERTAFFAFDGLWIGPGTGNPTTNLPFFSAASRFTERGLFVPSEDGGGSPTTFVDWTDLTMPRTIELPALTQLIPIPSASGGAPSRALGWQENEQGATFRLFALDAGDPSVLSTLQTELTPEAYSTPAWFGASHVYLSGSIGAGPRVVGAISVADDMLSADAPLFDVYAREVVSSGDWSYGVGLGSVEARAAGSESSARLELQAEVVDVAADGDAEAVLLRGLDGTARLEVTRGGVSQSVEVSIAAERVLAAGDRWVVLSVRSPSECAQLGGHCDGYQPHVAIAGGEPLAVIDELQLPSALPALGPLGQAEERWAASAESGPAPVDIGAGRWVLTRELTATCLTEADCETLGVSYVPISEANVAIGAQVCAPGPSSSCEALPEPSVYGTTTRRSYFVLDAGAATFSESVDVETEGDTFWSTALWSGPRRSGDTLLDLRVEALERVGGAPRRVRFWLERLRLSGVGLVRQTPLSIPGYPIGLIDAETLLSAQPESSQTGRARLHRLHLDPAGARVESSLALEARYGDVQIVGSHAVYVKLPTTSCEPETVLEAVAVDGDALQAAAQLALPGGEWRVVSAAGDQLILSEQNRGFARVRVGAGGELSLEGFATAPWYVQSASFRDGVLIGVSRDGVVRLTL